MLSPPYEVPGTGGRVFFGPEDYTETADCQAYMTHILNVTDEEGSTHRNSRDVCEVNWIYSDDSPDFRIMERVWPPALEWILAVLKENDRNTIYIHCHMGINRSATIAVALSAYFTRKPIWGIINDIRRRDRRLILTNEGFIEQLMGWQFKEKESRGEV